MKGLDKVDVSYTTGYGVIKSQWQRKNTIIEWHFTVPNNSTALVSLPNKAATLYSAGNYSIVYEE